ncbi:hypothetical protein, partial [Sphingomonas sp. 66-10]|uniref:hypothetical protein n=1 Tax=Sphingomonas sp. 66-10 TaxID=1895848 RepID=UPI00257B3C93
MSDVTIVHCREVSHGLSAVVLDREWSSLRLWGWPIPAIWQGVTGAKSAHDAWPPRTLAVGAGREDEAGDS